MAILSLGIFLAGGIKLLVCYPILDSLIALCVVIWGALQFASIWRNVWVLALCCGFNLLAALWLTKSFVDILGNGSLVGAGFYLLFVLKILLLVMLGVYPLWHKLKTMKKVEVVP
ncbi:hypothetical protein [Rubritalea halochordaticola]